MSNQKPSPPGFLAEPPTNTVSLEEMTRLLIKERGIHTGLYELAVTFRLALGPFSLPNEEPYPSLIGSVVGFDLRESQAPGPRVVDASQVNPKRRAKKASA